MKSLKKIGILIICLFLVTSCQDSPSASHVALNYYDLIVHQNTSPIISLGMPKETADTIVATIHLNLHQQIKERLSMNQLISVDEEKITQVEEAYFAALAKLTATAEERQKGSRMYVTLSTPYIDTAAVDAAATQSALQEVDITDFTDQTLYLTELTNAYIPHLIEGYETCPVSSDYHEATFEFMLQNGIWLPLDYEAFVSSLCSLVVTA